jgi:hypothetical protein
VDISRNVAITGVDEEFYNPGSARLEGTYIFPLPEGASIDKFSMDINGQMVEAELLDATKQRLDVRWRSSAATRTPRCSSTSAAARSRSASFRSNPAAGNA